MKCHQYFCITLSMLGLTLLTNGAHAEISFFDNPQVFFADKQTTDIVSGDINGDGYPDLAATNRYGDTITIAYNNGSGQFNDVRHEPMPETNKGPVTLQIGDLDGDGLGDIVAATFDIIRSDQISQNPYLVFKYNNGDGTFETKTLRIGAGVPSHIVIDDITGDGLPDVLAGNNGDLIQSAGTFDGGIHPFVNRGNRGFIKDVELILDQVIGGIARSVFMDFNSDGIMDLIGVDQGTYYETQDSFEILGQRVQFFRGTGTYLEYDEQFIDLSSSPHSIDKGDFNGDGNEDFIVAMTGRLKTDILFPSGTPQVEIYRRNNSTFQKFKTINTPGIAYYVLSSDFDLDGDMDFAVTLQDLVDGGNNHKLQFYENDGSGNFTISASYAVEGEPEYATKADFDMDGDMDVAVLSYFYQAQNAEEAADGAIQVFINQAVTSVSSWTLY